MRFFPSFVIGDQIGKQADDKLVVEMNETRTLSQPTYDRAIAALGLDRTIELITALGFYTMVAIMLNGFDAPVPGGERPLP